MLKKLTLLAMLTLTLSACGFRPQGQMPLAQGLHKLNIRSVHPFGDLTHYLEKYLKNSSVILCADPKDADAILYISQDDTAQALANISGTQQTRQYNLSVTVTFEVDARDGRTLVEQQSLTESRTITVQSNQILGSSNEANLYYQQMRRQLANAIMYRLSSQDVTNKINQTLLPTTKKGSR